MYFRRNKQQRKAADFEALVWEALDTKGKDANLSLLRVRRYDRKARTYRRIYEDPSLDYAAVEKCTRCAGHIGVP